MVGETSVMVTPLYVEVAVLVVLEQPQVLLLPLAQQ